MMMPRRYWINSLCVEINEEQVDMVSRHIYLNKKDLLLLTCGPEHVLPQGAKWGSLEHALYLTYTCLIDYNLKSVADDLWSTSRKLFEKHLEELYPENLVKRGPENFANIFKTYFKNIYRAPASPEKMALRVYKTAKYLLENVDGDPRKILDLYLNSAKKRDAQDFLIWLKNQKYKGLPNGDKVIKLWFRTMCESKELELGYGMWNFQRHELAKIPMPIDKNIISAGIALGLVNAVEGRFEGSFSELYEPFNYVWMQVSEKSQTLPLELDEPVWKTGRNCRRKKCQPDCFFKQICPKIFNFAFKGEKTAPGKEWDILIWPIRRNLSR
jgi:hypothetical protein